MGAGGGGGGNFMNCEHAWGKFPCDSAVVCWKSAER